MRTNIRWFALLLIMLLIAGCGGGGGGGGTSDYGGVNGYVYFDAAPASLSETTAANISATNSKIPIGKLRRTNTALSRSVAGERIVKFKAQLSRAAVEQIAAGLGATIKRKIYDSGNVYLLKFNSQTFSVQTLQSHPDIIYSEENLVFQTTLIPNDTHYATLQAWHLTMLRMPQGWDVTIGSPSVIVAVIDSGVSMNHPDLSANLVAGYDFIDDDSVPNDPYIPDSDPDTDFSHGTFVAGVVSAVTNNSMGVAGVGWNVKIMPIRVMNNDGSGSSADIAAGINWAVDHGAHVINLSLGFTVPAASAPQSMKDAIDNAIAHGVTVVAAAGNDYSGPVLFPANYAPVIAVGALGPGPLKSSYSNVGPEVWVCAPGGENSSAPPYYVVNIGYNKQTDVNGYANGIGTSMASPHIAGLVALLYSRGITSPEAVRERLRLNSTDLGAPGKDNEYGYGVPRADDVLNGSLPDLRSVKVFWGNIDGTVLGPPSYANGSGYYSLANIPAGPRYICAFLDRNLNGLVDAGDKFAYVSVTITANSILPNIDITVLQQASVTTPIPLAQYFKGLMNPK